MKQKSLTLGVVGVLVCWVLAACTSLFVAPQSISEKIAAGYIVQTAVLKSATVSLNAGDISSDDAQHVLKIATQAREVLDAAQLATSAGDIKTAEGRLTLATSLLVELQAFLREKS